MQRPLILVLAASFVLFVAPVDDNNLLIHVLVDCFGPQAAEERSWAA